MSIIPSTSNFKANQSYPPRDDELPFLIAHLSLLDEHGVNQIDRGSSPGSGPQSHVLYGNLVSAIDQPFEDLQGNLGLFFLFPDVSVRWIGRFRLRVTLVRISRCVGSTMTSMLLVVV